jgi:hypothetical protein
MSDQLPTQPPGPTRRNPFVTALLIFIGIILLLPGLCSVILTAVILQDSGFKGIFQGSSDDVSYLLLFFMIGVGGVALIVFAIRRR